MLTGGNPNILGVPSGSLTAQAVGCKKALNFGNCIIVYVEYCDVKYQNLQAHKKKYIIVYSHFVILFFFSAAKKLRYYKFGKLVLFQKYQSKASLVVQLWYMKFSPMGALP